jgi:DNA-binding response OmpR family regulator
MDGLALARRARRRWPDLGVIYVTDRPSRLDGHVLGARDRFLPRPVVQVKLVRALRGLLTVRPRQAA